MQTTLALEHRFDPAAARGFLAEAIVTTIGLRALRAAGYGHLRVVDVPVGSGPLADDDTAVIAAYAVRAQLRQAYGDIF